MRFPGGFALAILLCGPATAHDAKAIADEAMGDPARAKWFESLKQPNGGSCCNLSDCHQTVARQLANGTWLAIVENWKGKRWMPVPPDRVLKRPLSIDGEAYICNGQGNAAGENYISGEGVVNVPASDGMIYCFIPPIPSY